MPNAAPRADWRLQALVWQGRLRRVVREHSWDTTYELQRTHGGDLRELKTLKFILKKNSTQ